MRGHQYDRPLGDSALRLTGFTAFGVDVPERITFDCSGAVLGRVPIRQCLTTWGRLYELLKAAFPAQRYHFGHTLVGVDQSAGNLKATGMAAAWVINLAVAEWLVRRSQAPRSAQSSRRV